MKVKTNVKAGLQPVCPCGGGGPANRSHKKRGYTGRHVG